MQSKQQSLRNIASTLPRCVQPACEHRSFHLSSSAPLIRSCYLSSLGPKQSHPTSIASHAESTCLHLPAVQLQCWLLLLTSRPGKRDSVSLKNCESLAIKTRIPPAKFEAHATYLGVLQPCLGSKRRQTLHYDTSLVTYLDRQIPTMNK